MSDGGDCRTAPATLGLLIKEGGLAGNVHGIVESNVKYRRVALQVMCMIVYRAICNKVDWSAGKQHLSWTIFFLKN